MAARTEQELLEYIIEVTGLQPKLKKYRTTRRSIQVARFRDYPIEGQTTFVTLGASRLGVTMYRGLEEGFEITMTLQDVPRSSEKEFADAVLENWRISDSNERMPFIRVNGIYAPGYPPHLLFTDQVTCTPKLSGTKKFSDRRVAFLAAIPLDDVELREYDRSVPKLISKLKRDKRVAKYPRR